MSGSSIIAAIMEADAALSIAASEGRVKEDRLSDGVKLTAYLIRTISGGDRSRLKRGEFVRSTERVAVTVRAGSVRDRKAAIRLVRNACADRTGDFAGCFRVSVLTAGLGPSLTGPGDSYEQTQDFTVSFDEPVLPGERP